MSSMVRLNNVSKKFPTGAFALEDVSFDIEKGEFVFLVGPTGAGKTTVFKLIIRETLPTTGEIVVDNLDIIKLASGKIPHLRKKIGVVFQDLKLLMDRTIFENIILPLEISGIEPVFAAKLVEETMEKVGIAEHRDKFPIQLSGGELQKVAIARALTLDPEILLADEPTGNLDQATTMEIVKLLDEINKKGTTVIMATHNEDAIKTLSEKRVIILKKGRLADANKKEAKANVDNLEKKSDNITKNKKKDSPAGPKEEKKDEDF